jgi:hypothetical protein
MIAALQPTARQLAVAYSGLLPSLLQSSAANEHTSDFKEG